MLNNLGKIAVIITGEYRTWLIAKKYIFDFFNGYNVDYFFVTWAPIDAEEIRNSFVGHNLIDVRVEDTMSDDVPNFLLKAHLSKIANILKRRYEFDNKFIYDHVIEIRPDLYLTPSTVEAKPCDNFTIAVGNWWTYKEHPVPLVPDLYFRTTSAGHDVVSTRNHYGKFNQLDKFCDLDRSDHRFKPMLTTHDPHFMLYDFLAQRRMMLVHSVPDEVRDIVVVRPNFPNDNNYYTFEQAVEFYRNYS